jgi:hypothetical protein
MARAQSYARSRSKLRLYPRAAPRPGLYPQHLASPPPGASSPHVWAAASLAGLGGPASPFAGGLLPPTQRRTSEGLDGSSGMTVDLPSSSRWSGLLPPPGASRVIPPRPAVLGPAPAADMPLSPSADNRFLVGRWPHLRDPWLCVV